MKVKTGTNCAFYAPKWTVVSVWSLKRKIQALRIIEAVRHYASSHDGKFPKSLDEMKDVAIPIDPLTNQPFNWRVDEEVAMLAAPPLPADVVEQAEAYGFPTTMKYRLRIK